MLNSVTEITSKDLENDSEKKGTLIKLMPKEETRKCLCCGRTFEVNPFIVQDFCNGCFLVVARETFKADDNMTLKELKEKIKKELEVENGNCN